MTRPGSRTLTAIALALALSTAISGCASPVTWPARDIEGLHIPAVVWPEGTPNLDDERVAALINTATAMSAANNAHDFSSPALRDHATEEYITDYAKESIGTAIFRGSSDSGYYYEAGPVPMIIQEVRDTDTGAEIDVCSDFGHWLSNEQDYDPAAELGEHNKYGVERTYILTRRTDGTLLVSDRIGPMYSECSTNNVKYGLFDPQPDYGSVVYDDEFIQPDGSNGRPLSEYPTYLQPTPTPAGDATHADN